MNHLSKAMLWLPSCLLLLIAPPACADPAVDAAVRKGNALWLQRKFDQAEAVFKKAITDYPDKKLPYDRLAGLYLIQNEAGKAKTAYQEAITHDPDNPRLFLGLALSYMHLKRFSKAEAMTRRALELDPDSPAARKISGYLEENMRHRRITMAQLCPTPMQRRPKRAHKWIDSSPSAR